ncbi:hypothetical protein XENTR_v10010163 [Xenopus tropicalis]|nr:hypothetical protein XENTR_v10010163 [Xenopus tropicalis]
MSENSLLDVQIVPATAGDYDGVMSISGGIYNGADYLPCRYHEWLRDPQRRMFVAKSEGKVAIISVVIPNDQLEATIKLLKQRVESEDGTCPVHSMSPEEVLSWFENSTSDELFPKGILVQDWLPLSTHRSNLQLLQQRGVLWCYSNTSKPHTHKSLHASQKPTSLSLPHNSTPTSPFIPGGFLSLSTPPISVPLGDGMHRYDIDLFGTDPVAAKSHILHQVTEALRVLPTGGSVICFLSAEETLRAELTRFCQGIAPFFVVREQLVLEMDI